MESGISSPPRPATSLSAMFVRYVTGFGVGVGVGLSIYLGKLRVPGFAPLLDLIPLTLQGTLIPVSSLLMGIIAVVIQWYGAERMTKRWLRAAFIKTLFAAVVALAVLVVVHTFSVVSVPTAGGSKMVAFQVGFARPVMPPCPPAISDSECIKRLSFDPSRISSFWGDRGVRLATLCTYFLYLIVTGSFGVLVGLLILRNRRST